MKRMSILIALVAVTVVFSTGCRRRTRTRTVTETETIIIPAPPPPPPPTPVRPANGIVGILTGDDDSQVSDVTEDMVYDAIQLGNTDTPLGF